MRLTGEALKNVFKRPFTQKYPKVKPIIPEGLRGRVEHDKNKCIYCGMCDKYCPSGAIEVEVGRAWRYDMGRCLFCSQCEEVCKYMVRKNAITMVMDFEHAERKKSRLITIHKKPKPEK
ncbi:MAG: 4Fe-4S binding protein [Candidatus Aenigmatarchaeota archaeon]|nr:MAG: 4Fe-4S binding protein [Candidatus Aenigmarchaeota archaeon]